MILLDGAALVNEQIHGQDQRHNEHDPDAQVACYCEVDVLVRPDIFLANRGLIIAFY